MNRLAILSGAGDLPHIAIKEALSAGEDPLILAINESEFEEREYSDRTIRVHITQIGKVISICKKNKINRLLLLGKVNKDVILKTYKYDWKAITLLAKMLNRNDYSFFKIASEEFQKEKITIISQKTYLQKLFLEEGRYTKAKLSPEKFEDIIYGMRLAKELASLDIGQTVVVTNKMVLALEAIEGTDEAIKRGGLFSRNKGAVVCKSTKENQDDRFDLPAIGTNTLEIMKASGCDTIAIRSGQTIVVNPKEFIAKANEYKINFISYNTDNVKQYNYERKL